MEFLKNTWDTLVHDFTRNFIDGERYKWLIDGLGHTLVITFFALIIGIVIGIVVAAVRSTYDKNQETFKKNGGIGYVIMSALNWVCNLYLTVFRGTPVVVQLMIFYFVIFVTFAIYKQVL